MHRNITTAIGAPMARDAVVGIDQLVPRFDGRLVPYVNLDDAASTPALRAVADTIEAILPFYSGAHRGTGHKSRLSTTALERARELVEYRADIDGSFHPAGYDKPSLFSLD